MASIRLVNFIGGHEGFVERYYLDPAHHPTIGYGFTWGSKVFRDWWMGRYGRKFRPGDTISQADAAEVLSLLIDQEYAPPVDRKFAGKPLHVREAGTSFVYNAGPGALSWKWAAAVVRGDMAEAGRLWRTTAVTSGGKRFPGLVRRRGEEATIAERNIWPSWVQGGVSSVPKPQPSTHTYAEDIKQAQQWLAELGYNPGPVDGISGPRTKEATKRFQRDHGQLKVDGIIGPATMSALQRAIDLRNKSVKVGAGGAATSGAGAAENATGASETISPVDTSWLGDALLWGGVIILVAGIVWLSWRYKDEITSVLRRL